MNILLINHYAGSPDYGMEFRPFYLANEWIKMGHNVTIIAASYSHLRIKQPLKKRESINGINYLWIKTIKYNSNGIYRIISWLQFTTKLAFKSREITKSINPNVIISSSTYPFDFFPSNLLSKKSNSKLIFEVHDLWPMSVIEIGGYSKYNPMIMLMQFAENFAYKKCHKVVSLLDKALPHMQKHGLEVTKFSYIPNGYSSTEFESHNEIIPHDHALLLSQLIRQGKFVVGYAGGHAKSNALETLINAALLLKNTNNIVFVLVGSGTEKENLIKKVNDIKIQNVFFLPPVSKKSIGNLLNYFNIGYIGGIHSTLHQYGTSPNKLTDYMLASLPIIYSIDESNSLVEQVGCGKRVPAENPELIADAIFEIYNLTENERIMMGVKGYKYAKENLEYSVLANRFLQVL